MRPRRSVQEAGRWSRTRICRLLIEDVFGADVAVIELDDGFDGLAASSADAKLVVLSTSQHPSTATVHARPRAWSPPLG